MTRFRRAGYSVVLRPTKVGPIRVPCWDPNMCVGSSGSAGRWLPGEDLHPFRVSPGGATRPTSGEGGPEQSSAAATEHDQHHQHEHQN